MDFSNLADFAAHLALVPKALEAHEQAALKKSAEIIEARAKAKIGSYQPGVGPFPAWAPLAESTLKYHANKGVGDTPLLVEGQLRDSIEHEVHPKEAIIGSKNDIAFYQEFGTASIPPRPFIGPAALEAQDEVEKVFAEHLVSGIMGGNAFKSRI